MPTTTTNFGLNKPLVNNATDQDLWGGFLNGDLDNVDGLLSTALNWTPSPQTATFTVTIPTSGTTTTGSARTLYLCNAVGGAIVPALPAASTASGLTIAFKKTDSSVNPVTITGHSTDTIDGSNTLSLTTQFAYAILVCDGTNWDILSENTVTSGLAPLASPMFTGNPTAPTPSGTDNSTSLSTTAFLPLWFLAVQSLGNSGYQKLPGGLIIQWGRYGSSASGNITINFPISFSTACYIAIPVKVQSAGVNDGAYVDSTPSTTSFGVHIGSSGTDDIYWIAIGK